MNKQREIKSNYANGNSWDKRIKHQLNSIGKYSIASRIEPKSLESNCLMKRINTTKTLSNEHFHSITENWLQSMSLQVWTYVKNNITIEQPLSRLNACFYITSIRKVSLFLIKNDPENLKILRMLILIYKRS